MAGLRLLDSQRGTLHIGQQPVPFQEFPLALVFGLDVVQTDHARRPAKPEFIELLTKLLGGGASSGQSLDVRLADRDPILMELLF